MAPDERSRVEASQALTEQLGGAAAAALMECIPPFGWHEIATKRDLDELERRIGLRFDARFAAVDSKFEKLEAKFEALEAKFVGLQGQFKGDLHAEATRMIKWTVGAVFGAITAICVAVATVTALVR